MNTQTTQKINWKDGITRIFRVLYSIWAIIVALISGFGATNAFDFGYWFAYLLLPGWLLIWFLHWIIKGFMNTETSK